MLCRLIAPYGFADVEMLDLCAGRERVVHFRGERTWYGPKALNSRIDAKKALREVCSLWAW